MTPAAQGVLPGARSVLCIPIAYGENFLGVLNVESHKEDAFKPADRLIMNTLADLLATALHNAFYHLSATPDPTEALVQTVGAGGDTDTNAAIAGALLGAAGGHNAWPVGWCMPVLTCRPDAGLGVARPRPEEH